MRITLSLILTIILLFSCSEPDYSGYNLEVIDTTLSKDIKYTQYLNPLTEDLVEIDPMYYYQDDRFVYIEKQDGHQIGAAYCVFKKIYEEKYFIDSIEIREVKAVDPNYRIEFQDSSHCFRTYILNKDTTLVVDNKFIYTKDLEGACFAINLIDKGIIADINPFLYVIQPMETLEEISKKYHVSVDNLWSWNPHIRYGYGGYTMIKINLTR